MLPADGPDAHFQRLVKASSQFLTHPEGLGSSTCFPNLNSDIISRAIYSSFADESQSTLDALTAWLSFSPKHPGIRYLFFWILFLLFFLD